MHAQLQSETEVTTVFEDFQFRASVQGEPHDTASLCTVFVNDRMGENASEAVEIIEDAIIVDEITPFFPIEAEPETVKLTGTPVGTPDALCGAGETVATIFDGDFNTAFDTGASAKNDAWAGIDFGEGAQKFIDSIRFSQRIPENLNNIDLMKERLASAKIYGANTLTFDGLDGATNAMTADTTGNFLYEIALTDFDGVNIEEFVNVKITSNTDKGFRYILIFFTPSSFGNISEFEVYGTGNMPSSNTAPTDIALSATAIDENKT